MNDENIRDMSPKDLERHIIGKVVTKVDTKNNTLTLNDGTVLEFVDAEECCAWFTSYLVEGNLTDNAVTSIEMSGLPDGPDYGDQSYTIHILAVDETIADLGIEGNYGSGYYFQSISLKVSHIDLSEENVK